MNNLEYPREPQFRPKNEINIGINVDTEELDSAILKAKELVEDLQRANGLIADFEKKNRSQSQEVADAISNAVNKAVTENATRKPLREMIDRICLLQFGCKSEHEVKVMKCNEFIETVKKMQGTDLEPYLAETKCTTDDRCYNIIFKIPIDPDNESKSLQR